MKIRLIAAVAALTTSLTGCVIDPALLSGANWYAPPPSYGYQQAPSYGYQAAPSYGYQPSLSYGMAPGYGKVYSGGRRDWDRGERHGYRHGRH